MAAEMIEVEVHVLVGANGDFVVSTDPETLGAKWTEDIGDTPDCSRTVTVKLRVPKPTPIVLTGTVPAEASEGAELRVA